MKNRKEEPVVFVDNVHKSFKEIHAVRGVNLKVYPGQFLALLGPNGAGKTTLVEMIEGIQFPDSGEISIKGMNWKGNHTELNHILGISLQETWFIEKLTVLETLRLFASFYGLGKERVEEVIDMIQLDEKRKAYTKNLSGGQRQRLALGLSLLNYPEILLLDEPTTGLDPNARRDIWNILLNLKKEKKTSLILTTHYMEEAQFLCDYIVIMDQGKTLARGTIDDLLENCETTELIEITPRESPKFDISMVNGVNKVNYDEDHQLYRLEVDKIVNTLPVLLNKFEESQTPIGQLQCRTMNLDDLFTSMTGRKLNA
jgi:ABC-2 type transport system ATP-binding protein